MWCLGRLLPLMIGHRVPEDDEHWRNFLLLLRILDYMFASVVSKDCVAYLKELISDHHGDLKFFTLVAPLFQRYTTWYITRKP